MWIYGSGGLSSRYVCDDGTCGDGVFAVEEMPILSGFVAYFEGNISTKIGLKICACIEKLNMGVVKIDLLA